MSIKNTQPILKTSKWRKLRLEEPIRLQLNGNELARILQDSHSSCKILQDNHSLSSRGTKRSLQKSHDQISDDEAGKSHEAEK